MTTESTRHRFKVIGHIVEHDDRVRHYLQRVTDEGVHTHPGYAPEILTSKLDIIPTDTVIEVITSWEPVIV